MNNEIEDVAVDSRANGNCMGLPSCGKPLCSEDDHHPLCAAAPQPPSDVAPVEAKPFQLRVQPWMMACFGAMIAGDREERNHRFLEEALELIQSTGCTASEAHQLVDYVFGRPVGEPAQEVGGVMVTLAALCLANALDMHQCGETELARIWTKVEQIRAKQAAKPKYSPLPEHAAQPPSAQCDSAQEKPVAIFEGWEDYGDHMRPLITVKGELRAGDALYARPPAAQGEPQRHRHVAGSGNEVSSIDSLAIFGMVERT